MNWTYIILIGAILVGLVVYLIVRNQKDKQEFENNLNDDYPRTKDSEGDMENDSKI